MDREDRGGAAAFDARMRDRETRALQLCIRHLMQDAEALGLDAVCVALEAAAAAVEEAMTANGGA
ncbi:hypothetical protein [Caenispirillum bisanense]|uniref:Uncharacterized protein n=1 Tax=Caenispirillum bisanense TaxID=414052 RepID=A0A286H1A3_9PROT|nr:hypothetical protein [Caenispirillum bisanense]SOE01084.1 hypothetical protein SAMN05421508_11610 [Caenispirillum bisanense]